MKFLDNRIMDGLVHVFLGWHLNALQKLFIDSTVDLSRMENVFTQTPIIIKNKNVSRFKSDCIPAWHKTNRGQTIGNNHCRSSPSTRKGRLKKVDSPAKN